MEKFSIDDEDCESLEFNPVLLKALPKYVSPKGTLVEKPMRELCECRYYKNRKGFLALFLKSKVKHNVFLHFEGEHIYGYAKVRNGFVVKETWNLNRLLKLEIEKKQPENIKLVFINKSLNPADPLSIKNLQVPEHQIFLNKLKNQLESCDIDLIL